VALLSRNENPYGPSPSALKMIEYAGSKGAYYASQDAVKQLATMIAEKNGVAPEQIALTTGSGEALSAIAMIYGPNGPIVAPRLFWDTTALYAARLGMATIDRVPLKADMTTDLEGIEAKVTTETGLVQLCNPNNPTGLVADAATLKAAVTRMASKTMVLVDEAYMELADDPEGNTCISLIKDNPNVIVSRTFSKIYGMAGIRMGYTISSPEVAQKIQATAMSWSPCTSYAAAIGCYDDEEFLTYSKAKVKEAREMITTTLDTLGLEYLPSQTNFVFFKSGKAANDVQKAFAEQKISVRGQYMDYVDWTRVSTGKIEDVERFCKALPAIVGA
jgi:histidinol-phosphate aminotransferase